MHCSLFILGCAASFLFGPHHDFAIIEPPKWPPGLWDCWWGCHRRSLPNSLAIHSGNFGKVKMAAWLERPPRRNGSRCSCFSMQHAMISFVEGQSIGKCLRWACWVESVDTSQLYSGKTKTIHQIEMKKLGRGLQKITHHNQNPYFHTSYRDFQRLFFGHSAVANGHQPCKEVLTQKMPRVGTGKHGFHRPGGLDVGMGM